MICLFVQEEIFTPTPNQSFHRRRTMSNYTQPPSITDTCMVCYEPYGTKKNIFVPKTCTHPLCKVCSKKCKECPCCRVPYKTKKEMSEIQKKIKHIYFLRKSLHQFVIGVIDIQTKMGHSCDNHYSLIYNTMISNVLIMETELQNRMNAKDRKIRGDKLYNHPYSHPELLSRLVDQGLMVIPEN